MSFLIPRDYWDRDKSVPKEYTWCNSEEQTLLHFFWECPVSQKFWKNCVRWIKQICQIEHEFDVKKIILSDSTGQFADFINIFTIVAKHYKEASWPYTELYSLSLLCEICLKRVFASC